MLDYDKLDRLRGWVIRGWSLTPGQLLTLNMMRFSSMLMDTDRRPFGRLSFVSPSKIEFVNVLRDYGQEIEIETFETVQLEKSYSCVINTSREGTIRVTAQDILFLTF